MDHLKEDVIKIQQQNPYKRFADVRKDQDYIADFQVGLNALVSLYHIYLPPLSAHSLVIQPSFQVGLSDKESSQEASKSSYKYLTWYYILACTDIKKDVWKGPIMTELNKGGMSIERRNVGERHTITENGM